MLKNNSARRVGILALVLLAGAYPTLGFTQKRNVSTICLVGAGISETRAAAIGHEGVSPSTVARAILSGQRTAVIAMLSCGSGRSSALKQTFDERWNEQTLDYLEDLARDAGEKKIERSIKAMRKWKGDTP